MYKKMKFKESVNFTMGVQAKIMFKKSRDSIKHVVTLAKIQSAMKAPGDLSLMDNFQTFYSLIFIFVWGSLGLLLRPESKVQKECITS